jgi:hypothetical protein
MPNPLTEAMTEVELQRAVVEAATLHGWLWYHTHDSRRSNAGFPDLILIHPKHHWLLVVELKSMKGRTSAHQRQWLEAFSSIERWSVSIWTPADLDRALEVLRNPFMAQLPATQEKTS